MPATPVKPQVLFLCTGNACRSQMAEGWARHLAADRLRAYSAGTDPHGLDPRAVAVMAEVGVTIGEQRSKHLDALAEIDFDLVVTVCDRAQESCPNVAGRAKRIHVSFDDPPRLATAAQTPEAALEPYRRVRDEIRALVEQLLRDLP